jgi:hypothetical protein
MVSLKKPQTGFGRLPMTERSDRSFAGISSGQTALLPHVIYNRYGQRLRLTQPDKVFRDALRFARNLVEPCKIFFKT